MNYYFRHLHNDFPKTKNRANKVGSLTCGKGKLLI